MSSKTISGSGPARSSGAAGVSANALTRSELRVAQLAVGGQTNWQITQSLFFTQRTVENHLTSTYGKLGISSRPELPAELPVALDGSRPAIRGMAGYDLAPDVVGGFDDEAELGDLLVVGQRVALHGGGEAALAGQADLVQGHVLGRLVDPALEVVL